MMKPLTRHLFGGMAAATLGVALVLGTVAIAVAGNGLDVFVQVASASVTNSSGGQCTWDVTSTVVIHNNRAQDQTLTSDSDYVVWQDPSGVNIDGTVTVVNTGGLAPGATIAANGESSFSPVEVTFTIPCDATDGTMNFSLASSQGDDSGGASFLHGDTGVPIAGLAGALALVALLATGMVVLQRRRRRAAVGA